MKELHDGRLDIHVLSVCSVVCKCSDDRGDQEESMVPALDPMRLDFILTEVPNIERQRSCLSVLQFRWLSSSNPALRLGAHIKITPPPCPGYLTTTPPTKVGQPSKPRGFRDPIRYQYSACSETARLDGSDLVLELEDCLGSMLSTLTALARARLSFQLRGRLSS
jgi:hypothetical protein